MAETVSDPLKLVQRSRETLSKLDTHSHSLHLPLFNPLKGSFLGIIHFSISTLTRPTSVSFISLSVGPQGWVVSGQENWVTTGTRGLKDLGVPSYLVSNSWGLGGWSKIFVFPFPERVPTCSSITSPTLILGPKTCRSRHEKGEWQNGVRTTPVKNK